jgi:hypothetical protein
VNSFQMWFSTAVTYLNFGLKNLRDLKLVKASIGSLAIKSMGYRRGEAHSETCIVGGLNSRFGYHGVFFRTV